MTYFGFLLRFVVIPILIFLAIALWDNRWGRTIPGFQNGKMVWAAILIHVLLALLYTTPWDNYLVATGVWYYDPKLVMGIVLGYVPLEEYTFFILETVLCGLWWWFLVRRLVTPGDFISSRIVRLITIAGLIVIWLVAVLVLIVHWQPGTYLAITLVWALPPLAPQLLLGADILWHYRRLVALSILSMTFYLSVIDSLAIASGTWTIDPARSTGLFFGVLPIEEAVFFLVTNLLITFGLTLMLSDRSQQRVVEWRARGMKGLLSE